MVPNTLQQIAHQFRELVQRPFHRETPPFVYIALGDSTVEGVGASDPSKAYTHLVYTDLSRHVKNVQYQNYGKRGARVHDVVQNQLDKAIAEKPSLITLSIGANDVIRGTNLKDFRRDINHVLQTLAQTQSMVIFTNVPDFSFTRRVPKAVKPAVRMRIKQYNRIMARAADEHNATLVDTFGESYIIAKRFPEAVSDDNFHPSDLGYALWANTMLTVIHDKLRSYRRPLSFGL